MRDLGENHAAVTGEPAAPKRCTAGSGRRPLEKDPHSGNLASGLPVLKHGHGEVELEIRVMSGTIAVSVTDENPAPAVLKQAGPDDTSGRGMALVEAYSDRWGSSGEETWCEFRHDSVGSVA
ncbi:ATP-binding protein [Streptomyces celluloflavus]|uniref:ATP-binding protein n=1 Tax=Streptomyces celluloflavus TaxID=58344 RepID=UPI0034610781|nr:ATP-binding protein [Streptomyces celluloflavus]